MTVAGDAATAESAHEALDIAVDIRTTPILGSPNRLRLAVFSANMAGGANLSTAKEVPRVTWAESRRIAQTAERCGFEALIPVARWRGMASPQRREAHRSFETFTWAAGICAVTERIQVFATFHVPVMHPLAAAKEIATVDHISGGRFALNVVAGWNDDELRMFGVARRGHDDRYAFAEEWMSFLERIWAEDDEFDFTGDYFTSTRVLSEPKPLQTPRPVVMNAGLSAAGRTFAAKHADIAFALLPNAGAAAPLIKEVKAQAVAAGRELLVFGAAHIVCADTEAAARAEYERMVHELGDWEAADTALRLLIPNAGGVDRAGIGANAIAGFFALPLVGTPEMIVAEMGRLADAGVDGLALSWLDYDAGLAQYDAQLRPLLVESGLRRS